MDDQNKNLIMATALSFMVILVWFILFPPEEPPAERESVEAPRAETPNAQTAEATDDTARTTPEIGTAIATESPRVPIRTDRLEGSIALKGGRIDDLNLRDYRANLAGDSGLVSLLKPAETEAAHLALFGWAPGGDLDWDDVPGAQTPWSASAGAVLTTDSPLVLAWANDKGVTYTRTISIDEDFLFTVTQSVRNGSDTDIRLAPYGMLRRYGEPQDLTGFFIIQEGPIRQSGEEMSEFSYGDLRDFDRDERWGAHSEVLEIAGNGWLGFTDHYWMTTLVPPNGASFTSVLKYDANLDV